MATIDLFSVEDSEIWNLLPRFDFSEITSVTDTEIVIEYDEGTYPGQNDHHGYKLVAVGSGITQQGDQIVDGTITEFLIYDENGVLIAKFTDLSLEAFMVEAWFEQAGEWNLRNWLYSGDDVITGSANEDSISTGLGNDIVNAKGGNDWITDEGGRDTYNGGGGRDTLNYGDWFWNTYASLPTGIEVDMGAGTVVGPDGFVDTISGIERIIGTYMNDNFIGNAKDNKFYGLQGKDFFNGKGGWDEVDYGRDEQYGGELGIKAYLNKGYVIDGFGHRDTVKNIEGVEGTNFKDVIVGNGKNNWLEGNEGNDVIKGQGGDDRILGSNGRDKLWGGNGEDQFIFETVLESKAGKADKIMDFVVGEDHIAMWDELNGVFSFIGTSAFSNTAGELRLKVIGSDTLVQGDVDGDGNADFAVLVLNEVNLSADDFWL